MRIAFTAHLSEVSGAGIALVGTASAFREMGHDVFLVLPGYGELLTRARVAGLSVVVIENPEKALSEAGLGAKMRMLRKRVQYVAWLRGFLRQERIDVAYVNSSASVFAGVAAWLAGVPVVWHIHETLTSLDRKTKFKKKVIRLVARRLVYASESGRRNFSPEGLSSMIARNAIDLERLREVRRIHSVRTGEVPVLLSNGTVRRKGTDVLLRAMKLLQAREPRLDVRLVVTGAPDSDPDFFGELKEIASTPELEGRVEFVGIHDSLTRFLEQANVYVSASRNEAMPIAVVEAMAGGVPVVATRVGDCANLLEEGRCGWIVAPDDPNELAAALAEVLTQSDEAQRRAEAAAEKVDHLYGAPDFWQELNGFVVGAVGE